MILVTNHIACGKVTKINHKNTLSTPFFYKQKKSLRNPEALCCSG